MRIALQERLAAKMSSTHDYVYMSQDSLTEMYTYLDSQNGQLGPFSLNQLFSWCAAGQMPPTTMVRLDKPNETFRALFDVPGFSTWVHPFAQTWHSLAQHEQQQLPPPQLTPGLVSSTPPARTAAVVEVSETWYPRWRRSAATAAAEAADAAAQLTEPPTPATAPRPTVPSQPDAQLPASSVSSTTSVRKRPNAAARQKRAKQRHADEVAGLRARLEEETQARQRAESAQEEMHAAKRARLEQSDREAAAVAWRDAAGSAAAMEMEVVDSDGFMARFLAFRQARSRHLHAPCPP